MDHLQGPQPIRTSDWHSLKDWPPKNTYEGQPILVYWETKEGFCFLNGAYDYADGVLTDEEGNEVTDKEILENAIWTYWPDGVQKEREFNAKHPNY